MSVSSLMEAAPAPVPGPAAKRKRRRLPPSLIAGGLILGVIVALALAAPLLAPDNPTQITAQILAGSSWHHLLGTDQLGRDVFSRLLYGGRIDLRIAFLAVLAPFAIGTILGAISGYFGGWLDMIIMRVADVVVAFPFYVLALLLVFLLGAGVGSIIIAITAVSWVSYARIVRGETLVAKSQEYVLAAQVEGLSVLRVIGRHILPNVITQAIVFAMSDIVYDLLFIVTLSYLGLGIAPPAPDWGDMMSSGQQFLGTDWQLVAYPGLVVVITALGLSLIGDGLADLLRPE